MELIPNPLEGAGVKLLRPKVFTDDRGYFFESYNEASFEKLIGTIRFRQDNQSCSQKGVVRGLHYQVGSMAQTKLVRVVKGAIWDVAVDLRKDSPTFNKWYGLELSEENGFQLLIPQGFGHGFVSLSEGAIVCYKVDNFYSKEHDRGIRYDDPTLAIAWPIRENLKLSNKDAELPTLQNAEVFGHP